MEGAQEMTLLQVIRRLEAVALAQPAVRQVVENDAYRLNELPDAKYGVFAFTQGRHSASADNGLKRYAFTLMYIDRLTEDHGNELEAQSTGDFVLDNILRTLAEEWEVSDWTTQTFTQRFADDCAGAYTDVTFGVPMSAGDCAEGYDDLEGIL